MSRHLRRRLRWTLPAFLVGFLANCPSTATSAAAASGTVHFESGPVHPVAVSPDGTQLMVLNPAQATAALFRREPDGTLVAKALLPVGLEPVSVRWQDRRRVWVACRVSGVVTVIDTAGPRVERTLAVGAEPADIAFAMGRGFVTAMGEDAVTVFDLSRLDLAPQRIPLSGRKPRTLAISADGRSVHGVFLLSGNGTRVVSAALLHRDAGGIVTQRLNALGGTDPRCAGSPPPDPPLPQGLVRSTAPPKVGRIVGWNSSLGAWVDAAGQRYDSCGWDPPEEADLFSIDADSLKIDYREGIGTVLFGLALHPKDGSIWIPHTDARNRVRFEHPSGLKNHIVDQRLARLEAAGEPLQLDLNAHLEPFRSEPFDLVAARAAARSSVAQPVGMVWEPTGRWAWIAAMGSGELVRVDGTCRQSDCILGAVREAAVRIDTGGLPVGLEIDPEGRSLYALDAAAHELVVIDLLSEGSGSPESEGGSETRPVVRQRVGLAHPPDLVFRLGRRQLHDARSGSLLGDASCASCHVFGDRDGLSWDLGNPEGEFVSYADVNLRFVRPAPAGPEPCDAKDCAQASGFAAEKGPMATQTLREMRPPLHWRGDRDSVHGFNRVFVELLGLEDLADKASPPQGISEPAMARLDRFLEGLSHPPNPLRSFDGSVSQETVRVPGTKIEGSPSIGAQVFRSAVSPQGNRCVSCHAEPDGSAGGALTDGRSVAALEGDFKIAGLRGLRDKHRLPGFGHEGAARTLAVFLASDEFRITPQQSRDLAAFLVAFPSAVPSAVGVTSGPKGTGPSLPEGWRMGEPGKHPPPCEWVARWNETDPEGGPGSGQLRGARFTDGAWVADRGAGADPADLERAVGGLLTCVQPGMGRRWALDRDGDGLHNGDDCAPDDPGLLRPPSGGLRIVADKDPATGEPFWAAEDLTRWFGWATTVEWIEGDLGTLRSRGIDADSAVRVHSADGHPMSALSPGQGLYRLAAAVNRCGSGGFGVRREALSVWNPSLESSRRPLPAE